MPLPQTRATPHPDRGRLAAARLRPLPGQAHGRRRGRGLGDDLPRRPRVARRGGALPPARRRARGARRRCAVDGQRPLDRLVPRRRAPAAGSSRSRPGSTASRRGATSCAARSRPGQTDLDGELAEGAALLKVLELDVDDGARRRPSPTAPRRRRLVRRSTVDVDRERRPLRRLVRALPALVGRVRGRRAGAARARRARLRRRLPAADPPDRPHEPQGAEQRARRPSRATRAARGRSAARTAATPRSTRSSARSRTSTGSSRAARKLGARDRARLRDPVLARPPVAEASTRSGSTAARTGR